MKKKDVVQVYLDHAVRNKNFKTVKFREITV